MEELPPGSAPVMLSISRGTRLVDAVVERLTAAILSEQFRAGEKLVETRLASQLGVSRGPIRDAFRRLEQVGLVESRPYQGTFVAELTEQDVQELYAVRAPLEGMAARLLAVTGDRQAVERLELLVEEMRRETVNSRLIELDLAFHTELIELTGYRLLIEVWNLIDARLRKFLLLKRARLYHTPQAACALHEVLVKAILSGDPDLAEHAVREHILAARRSAKSEQDVRPDFDYAAESSLPAGDGVAGSIS